MLSAVSAAPLRNGGKTGRAVSAALCLGAIECDALYGCAHSIHLIHRVLNNVLCDTWFEDSGILETYIVPSASREQHTYIYIYKGYR